jgi:hypothetical protein
MKSARFTAHPRPHSRRGARRVFSVTSRDVALGDDGFDDDDGFDFVDRFLEEKRTNERGGVTNSKNK